MNTHSKIAVFAISALMSASSLATVVPAFAGNASPAVTTAAPAQPAATQPSASSVSKDAVAKVSETAKDDAIIKTVDDAYKAMREIQAARLAIFNGSTDDASKLVDEAQVSMKAAQDQAKAYEIKTAKQANEGDAYIPFDTSLTLAEGFKPTTEKQAAIDKANEHLSKGHHKEAVEVLKAGNIDVVASAALIPANASLSHINDAVSLMKDKKFYEANLALKAVQDSVIVDSYGTDAIPAQGSAHG